MTIVISHAIVEPLAIIKNNDEILIMKKYFFLKINKGNYYG